MKRVVEIIWIPRPASKPDDGSLAQSLARMGAKIRRQQRRKAGAA